MGKVGRDRDSTGDTIESDMGTGKIFALPSSYLTQKELPSAQEHLMDVSVSQHFNGCVKQTVLIKFPSGA